MLEGVGGGRDSEKINPSPLPLLSLVTCPTPLAPYPFAPSPFSLILCPLTLPVSVPLPLSLYLSLFVYLSSS